MTADGVFKFAAGFLYNFVKHPVVIGGVVVEEGELFDLGVTGGAACFQPGAVTPFSVLSIVCGRVL